MSIKITAGLASLESKSSIPDIWVGKPFSWIKLLSAKEAGMVGEQLAKLIFQGSIVGKQSGYDLHAADGRRMEVKLCRISASKTNTWSWSQIRPASAWTHLCLIAVTPSNARMFVIPKEAIPPGALSNQHGVGADGTFSQLKCSRESLFEWIVAQEVK